MYSSLDNTKEIVSIVKMLKKHYKTNTNFGKKTKSLKLVAVADLKPQIVIARNRDTL